MADYLPRNAEEFESWLQNFVAVLSMHAVDLDVDAAELTALSTARTDLDTAIADQVTKKNASKAATAVKRETLEDGEELVRTIVRRIVTSPNMTNDLRQELGLNVPDETHSTPSNEVGEEIPGIYLEALPGRVLVHFGTDPMYEYRNTKPAWATGCVVYRKSASESQFRLLGFQKKSPFVDEIVGPGTDYTYYVRYQGKTASDLGVVSSIAVIAAGGVLAA